MDLAEIYISHVITYTRPSLRAMFKGSQARLTGGRLWGSHLLYIEARGSISSAPYPLRHTLPWLPQRTT